MPDVASYTSKTQDQSTFEVGNQVDGVRTGLVTRSVNAALQASVFTSAGSVGGFDDTVAGAPGGQCDPGHPGRRHQSRRCRLGAADRIHDVAGAAVVNDATVHRGASRNHTREHHQQHRQYDYLERNSVQSQIVSTVATLIPPGHGSIDHAAIMVATASGQSTSNLEDQRDAALQTLSGTSNLTFSKQADGNITILGQGGFSIPLDATFSTSSAVLNPQSTYTLGPICRLCHRPF